MALIYDNCAKSMINKHLKNVIDTCFVTNSQEIQEGVFGFSCKENECIEINYAHFGPQSCDYLTITVIEHNKNGEKYHYHHEVPLRWDETTDIDTVCVTLAALINGWKKDTKN